MNPFIYHLVDVNYLEKYIQVNGPTADYFPAPFDEEKFIHCCTEEQIPKIIKRYFSEIEHVKLMKIDVLNIPSEIIYEGGPDGDQYPHIFGGIPPSAITKLTVIKP